MRVDFGSGMLLAMILGLTLGALADTVYQTEHVQMCNIVLMALYAGITNRVWRFFLCRSS